MYMKSKYKKTIIILSVVFIVAISVNVFTYAYSGKNVWKYFFGSSENEMSYLMEEYNQTVIIDDYTITLESAIFDDKTECIYSMFRVSKEGGKVEASICKGDTISNSFGENMRFSLWISADTGGMRGLSGEYEGNDLIIYGRSTYHCDETEDTHAIYLFDGKTGKTNFENYAAKFDLKPTGNTAEISVNDTTSIYISPIAIKILSTETINTERIEICYKDGTKEEVVNVEKKIGLGSSSESHTLTENTETYIFSDLKDIEKIESIIYNGEKFVK